VVRRAARQATCKQVKLEQATSSKGCPLAHKHVQHFHPHTPSPPAAVQVAAVVPDAAGRAAQLAAGAAAGLWALHIIQHAHHVAVKQSPLRIEATQPAIEATRLL